MSLPGRLYRVDGIRVFVHRAGPRQTGRPPVVLAHGFMVGHWEWRHVAPRLTDAGFEVVAFDFPGFGESDRPAPTEYGYDGDAFSRTLVGVLDALGIERAQLVGHSLGGAVSVLTAARRPERVEQLVLVDPLVYRFRFPPEGYALLTPVLGEVLFRTTFSRALIRHTLIRHIYRESETADEEWVDYLYERGMRPGALRAAHATLQYVARPGRLERSVRAIRCPTLIVWGEEDRLFPAAWARRLAGEIPGAEVRIIPACGHSPPEERPEELLRTMVPFLEEASPAQRRLAI